MGAIKRKTTFERIKQRAMRKSGQAILRARHALLFGPDMTRWLNGLLKESELTPEQRSALAYSGAWITAPFTVAQDILNGVVPKAAIRQKRRPLLFAETVCDIDPAILYRHWHGHPNDLERIRRLLGKMVAKQISAVVPITSPND